MNKLILASRARRMLLLGSSAAALTIAVTSAASAQCAPDPAVANQTTTCSGTDTDGIAIVTNGSTIDVVAGATVSATTTPAVAFEIPSTASASTRTGTLSVAGDVTGIGTSGVQLLSGAATGLDIFAGSRLTITVGATGSISGTNAITVGQSAGNTSGPASIALDNAGSITGTGGAALLSLNPAATNVGFVSITNRAGGAIGAISAPISSLSNAGLITGGSLSAISGGTLNLLFGLSPSLTNTGTINSNSSSATIVDYTGSITNSGSIANAGAGAAISSASFSLNNSATGVISSAGTTALSTTVQLNLVNGGQINGNVIAGSGSTNSSTVDSTTGTINGSLTFGAGNDILVARYANGALVTGVTGAIDGGGGNRDTLQLALTADTAINAPIALPTGFELLGLNLTTGTTTTLGENFSAANIVLYGAGTVLNRGTIEGAGQVLVTDGLGNGSFVNSGTIRNTSPAATQPAISVSSYSFSNSGMVSAVGDGIYAFNTFANSGTITASGMAIYQTGGGFNNSGTIRSTNGLGARLFASSNGISAPAVNTNSGVIEGATTGAEIGSSFANSGTVRSAGVAIRLSSGGRVENLTGGVITGGVTAIGTVSDFRVGNIAVSNAGTINGNVTFSPNPQLSFEGGNVFFAQPGGTLNGNLALGFGDYLVAELAGSGNGKFAGITGTVTADRSYLKYRVRSDISTVYAPISGFQSIGYELFDGAKLSLTTAGGNVAPISLAGTGRVDLTANIATSAPAAIASVALMTNPGTTSVGNALDIVSRGAISYNREAIANNSAEAAVVLRDGDRFENAGSIVIRDRISNSFGTIAAVSGGSVVNNSGTISLDTAIGIKGATNVVNSGSITQLAGTPNTVGVQIVREVTNSGTINVGGTAISNTIQLSLLTTITNTQTGTISGGAFAINVATPLKLTNAGTIFANSGSNPIAVQTASFGASSVINTGTITGSIQLNGVGNTVENSGTINGNVNMGGNNDTYTQRGSGTVTGVVDGGAGTDIFIVDSTGNGSLNSARLTNFEQLRQIGTGTVAYSGAFQVASIALDGGAISVASGQTLSTQGSTTITGGNGGVSVTNNGTIGGAVLFGSGDDSYIEGNGSQVGSVNGGGGINTYGVLLTGDRTGIGARSNFQKLSVGGTGRLTLTLDQDYQGIALSGTGLALSLSGHATGAITGGAGDEQLAADGDLASVSLGGGNDLLSLATTTLAGTYDGGAGTDTMRIQASAPITLSGTVSGFESIEAPNALTITGTLQNDGRLLFASNGAITVADGGTLAGTIDLGAASSFRLAAGATLRGSVTGGANSAAIVALSGDRTLSGGLSGFRTVATEGTGMLTLAAGNYTTGMFSTQGGLTVAADANLRVTQLSLGSGNDRLVITGGFSGSVDGGAGSDSVEISSGSAASPVAFGNVANVEALRMTGGFATIAGAATFGNLTLAGGRLVGLAGSTIGAPTIAVSTGATFGSAGTVNGNVAVAGVLSPGASPGTMTINGNVSLASGSTTLFEITPTVSDKIVVNGQVTIASGAVLQFADGSALKPGGQLDLVTATGGISGSFSTVLKPTGFFGLVVQSSDRIRLLGQFLNDPSFSPQVSRTIDYVNGLFSGGQASAALLAAAPGLVTAAGGADVAKFALIAPEPHAAARQIAIENGLTVADAARGDSFAQRRDEAGLFSFGTVLGNRRTIKADAADGTARSRISGYGLLAGLGWAGPNASVAVFGGYLVNRQQLAALNARTDAKGFILGAHGSLTTDAFHLQATVSYDDGEAKTRRAVPDGTARSRYDLRGWTFDAVADYALWSNAEWSIRPRIGVTAIRATRDSVQENGSNAFALGVARKSGTATFTDAGFTLRRPDGFDGAVQPYLTLGTRYQLAGRASFAVAGLSGGSNSLLAESAMRSKLVASGSLGAQFNLSDRLSLFTAVAGQTGNADRQITGRTGISVIF